MAIISDDLDRHFRAAMGGRQFQRLPTMRAPIERRLPKLAAAGPHAGVTSYSRYLSERTARLIEGSADIADSSPEIRNPLLSLINFYLPYDRKTLNQWFRYYIRTDPYINNCWQLNSQFPISDFHFTGTNDEGIIREHDEMKERCRMLQHASEQSGQDEGLGECYTFWQWDDTELSWVDYTILNPDRLDVREINWGSGPNAFYSLDPPEELKALLRDPDPLVQDMLQSLDPVVLEALSSNRRIPLDPFNVMALVRKADPYDARGTSPLMPVLKACMYKDKLIETQYAVADQQITPVQLWRVGNTDKGYTATPEDIQNFRETLLASRHDPTFTIISHDMVSLELIGYTGKLLPIIPELEWVAKQIMIGMYTNDATVTGAGPSFGAAVVPFKILQGRYQAKRNKMTSLYREKLLRPFAEARQIYKPTQANLSHRVRTRRQPLVLNIEWNFKLDLTDSGQKIQFALQLREKTQLAMKVICELLNLDYQANKKALKEEEGTVVDPVYQAQRLEKMKASAAAGAAGGAAGALPAPSGGGETSAGDETEAAAPAGDVGATPAAEPGGA